MKSNLFDRYPSFSDAREPKSFKDILQQAKRPIACMAAMTLGVTAAFMAGADKDPRPKGFHEGATLAVLGDSVPAGMGVEDGLTFPEIIGQNFNMQVENAAWSGADIHQITNGEGDRSSQLNILDEDTSAVFLMFGGNDTPEDDVRNLYGACLIQGCEEGTLVYTLVENSFNSENMVEKYHGLFTETLERAPNAEVYFIGYYKPINTGRLAETACRLASDDCSFFDNGSAQLASDAIDWLNHSAKRAMNEIDSSRLHFVQAPEIGALGQIDIASRLLHDKPTTHADGYALLHPTNRGHQKIAEGITAHLARKHN